MSDSFICPMGIEWKAGSEKYLSGMGVAHHQDAHTNMDDNKAHQSHGTHSSETKTKLPQDCPITITLTFIQIIVLHSLSVVMIYISFKILRHLFYFKIRVVEPLAKYYLYPCKHAPPYSVS